MKMQVIVDSEDEMEGLKRWLSQSKALHTADPSRLLTETFGWWMCKLCIHNGSAYAYKDTQNRPDQSFLDHLRAAHCMEV